MSLSETAHLALAAYGGESLWRSAKTASLLVSAHGWAFRLKWRAPMVRVGASIDITRPFVRLTDDARGVVGVLDGQSVRLEDPRHPGRVLASRDNPRANFPYGRRLFYWDELDHTYFAAYALWNYVTLPALLMREDITWTETRPGTLDAVFPSHLPTHSPRQRFHFDVRTGRLRQHDYTAEVFGGWARAAHVVLAHDEAGGVPFASRRRVTPRLPSGTAAPGPLLVGITFEDVRMKT